MMIFLFPLAYSPGPGNVFFAANSARFGWVKTWPALIGYHSATWIATFTIGLAFAGVSRTMPQGLSWIKTIGALYVFYLAWKFWRAGTDQSSAEIKSPSFVTGAVLLVFNPKAYVIMALLYSQFPAKDIASAFWIATLFTLNNLIAFSVWGLAGSAIHPIFCKPSQAKIANRALGILLAITALWMMA